MQNSIPGPGRPSFQNPGATMRFNAPNYPVSWIHFCVTSHILEIYHYSIKFPFLAPWIQPKQSRISRKCPWKQCYDGA